MEDGYQMYSRGLVIGEALFTDPQILPTATLIFTGRSKIAKFGAIFDTARLQPPVSENAARYLNTETNLLRINDHPMSSQSLVKFGPCIHEKHLEKMPYTLKLHSGSVLNRQ